MPVITLRVSEAEKAELEARAEGSVSALVRRLLFERPDPIDVLEAVYDRLAGLENRPSTTVPDPAAGPPPEAGSRQVAIQAETLLLLRYLSKPDTKNAVQSELARLGMTPWSAGKEG